MKKLIKKILKEEQLFNKSNYYREVAKMIVDRIEINHTTQIIYLPFVGGIRNDIFYKNGESPYSVIYNQNYLLMPELPIYLQKYGLQPHPGILMVIRKLIEKGIQEKIDQSIIN